MLTIDALRNYGANINEGLTRCMNNEAFYLRLVGIALKDKNIDALKEAVAENDLDKAFEAAHGLKGVMGNLALTPVYDPVSEITELLRKHTEMDYSEYIAKIDEKFQELKALAE